MILKLLLLVAGLIVVCAIVVAFLPPAFRYARSTSIDAPPSAAFAQVNDLHRWLEMSPYAKLDPAAKYTFEGPAESVGASVAWTGNNAVGAGRMTITESRPDEYVRMRLEFLKPFAATHTAEFIFAPEGRGTEATWSMSGRNSFMFRALGLIMNCDKMIGGQFEEGLANMKRIAEEASRDHQTKAPTVALAQSH